MPIKKLVGLLFTMLAVCYVPSIEAKVLLDVYGLNDKESQKLLHSYGKQIADIEEQWQKIQTKLQDPAVDMSAAEAILIKREELKNTIKKDNKFLFVEFSTVLYPEYSDAFTTVEVVSNEDTDRLDFVQAEAIHVKPKPEHPDLIDKMNEFTQIDADLIMRKAIDLSDHRCPVYHCISSFNHKKLMPYLAVFNEGAIKQKSWIIDVLNKDIDPERRAAAAFLLGHFKDPSEIVRLLSAKLQDPSPQVRNNALRVIAATIKKANIKDINPAAFIALLNSPSVTDRNKSLMVLKIASLNKQNAAVIAREGKKQLLALLKLKQPNNHQPSYEVLKQISQKQFSEYDYKAWQAWLNKSQKL